MHRVPFSIIRSLGQRTGSERGVSILELMIVVVIIGLVAAMAGPRFSREMNRMEFRGDTRNTISTLRQARSLAITNKAQYGVDFNAVDGSVTLFKDVITSDPPALNTGDSIIQVDTISGDYPIVASSFVGSLIFSPNGSASESGIVLVMAYGLADNYYTTSYAILNVLASTGRSKMSEIYFY